MKLSSVRVRFTPREQLFAALCALVIVTLWTPLNSLIWMSLQDERYTHILVVPVISGAFLFLERERIFLDSRYCPAVGIPLMLFGLLMVLVSRIRPSLSINLTVPVGAAVLLWIGAFVLCYGLRSYNTVGFPFLLLLLMIPIPSWILNRLVAALQAGSAELSYLLFRVAGVPIWRHGTLMALPGVDIEVAPQCSGMRSSMALVIAGAIISRVLLRTGWARVFVILCIGPIAIFRNAVRIVCISLLGVYVDRGFFFGHLHHYGGIPFSLVGFAILIPLVWVLRRWEQHVVRARVEPAGFGLNGSPGRCPVG
jgi:exosortase